MSWSSAHTCCTSAVSYIELSPVDGSLKQEEKSKVEKGTSDHWIVL